MSEERYYPAFPVPEMGGHHAMHGMTLLDYFAAKAMQALLVQEHYQNESYEIVAEEAYTLAYKMLIARDKE